MAKILKIFLMILPLLAVSGCNGTPSVDELQKLIQQSLKPGDPATKIEGFFKQNKLPYDFDWFNHAYQSRVPSSEKTNLIGVESVIMISIHVNQDRSFQSADVRRVYTYF